MKKNYFLPILALMALMHHSNVFSISIQEQGSGICTDEGKSSIPKLYPEKGSFPSLNGVNYTVRITGNLLKFQASDCDPLTIRLSQNESKKIKDLSLEFVKLLQTSKLSFDHGQGDAEVLDGKDLNPIFDLTDSDLSIRFAKAEEESDDSVVAAEEDRSALWRFLTRFAEEAFHRKLKELKVTIENPKIPLRENLDNFPKFLDSLSKIMKISVKYAEDNFKGWTTSKPEIPKTDAEEVKKNEKSASPPGVRPPEKDDSKKEKLQFDLTKLKAFEKAVKEIK